MIDQYCERTVPGLFNEPFNALTNLAFVIAAYAALRLYRRAEAARVAGSLDILLLIVLLFCIGVGSLLWHTFAERWAELADELPIMIFISVYLLSYLRRVFRLGWLAVAAGFVAYQLVNRAVLAAVPADFLNGSIFYLPTLATLGLFAARAYRARDSSWPAVPIATGLLVLSLAFRTLDGAVCSMIPVGTHFLWHLLNAYVLYRLLAVLIGQKAVNGKR
jgi:hypothetical protein